MFVRKPDEILTAANDRLMIVRDGVRAACVRNEKTEWERQEKMECYYVYIYIYTRIFVRDSFISQYDEDSSVNPRRLLLVFVRTSKTLKVRSSYPSHRGKSGTGSTALACVG